MKPIPNRYVLDSIEILVVKKAISDYNEKLVQLKSISQNIYIFDLSKVFTDIIAKGYKVPGSTTLTNRFISGEMFSLDGVHPTAKGYGVITNELIKYLNSTFNSDIPLVSIQNLPSNYVTP